MTLRDVEAGEELSYDYKFAPDVPSRSLACRCGAATCRKTMNLVSSLVHHVSAAGGDGARARSPPHVSERLSLVAVHAADIEEVDVSPMIPTRAVDAASPCIHVAVKVEST